MLKPFSGEKILSPVEMGPKNGGFWGKWGSKPQILVTRPPKRTSLRGTTSFYVFCVKIGARVSAVAFLKNQKKQPSLCAEGREITHAQNRTPKPIWINFCMVVDIPDVVTYTNFGNHRLRGFWVAGGQISPSPIDFHRRPYNTLALPCERVTMRLSCTVFEIQPFIRKSPILTNPTCIRRPRRG